MKKYKVRVTPGHWNEFPIDESSDGGLVAAKDVIIELDRILKNSPNTGDHFYKNNLITGIKNLRASLETVSV